jgi:hypothetical protein
MAEFALFIDDVFQEIRRYDTKPPDLPHKNVTWHDVVRAERIPSTLTQDPVERWSLVNNVWTQSWDLVNVSAEEAARRQRLETERAEAEAVRLDAFVQNFVSMTPSSVETYVANNTANLGAMRSLVSKMALMLLILAKRQFR